MGQDKKQLTQLLAFIKDLYDNPDNKEFAAGINAITLSETKEIRDARFDEIYEYCIEKNARKQANAFYENFPIEEIKNKLIHDYLLMESFKRRGDFFNYSAHLFKQIECISSFICNDDSYNTAFKNLYNSPSLIDYSERILSISSRKVNSSPVYKLLFDEYTKKDNKEKNEIALKDQYIKDKIIIALYFGGYNTCLFNTYEFNSFKYKLSDIYLIRCEADHGGNKRSEKEETKFEKIIAEQDQYYTIFLKTLFYFVDKISEGFSKRKELFDYSKDIPLEEKTAVVSSALPGALFIRLEGQSPIQVPQEAYSKSMDFHNDMEVLVSVKGGTILKVTPIEQS